MKTPLTILWLLLVPAAASAEAGTFDIVVKGLRAGELTYSGSVEGGRYQTSGRLRTIGVISLFKSATHEASSRGRVVEGRFQPELYIESSDTGSRQSASRMDYRDGIPGAPVGERRRKRDVDPATQGRTVDPMTAIYAVLRDAPRADLCRTQLAIFDGHKASRVTLAPEGEAGPGLWCSGAYVRVDGYSREDMAERTVFPFRLRYAPLGDGRWRVTEVALQTTYGAARLIRR